MQTASQFQAQSREPRGKGAARELRRQNLIPGVVYGRGSEATSIALPEKELRLAYHKGGFYSKIVSIELGGQTFYALPKQIDLHPVTDKIEHIDLIRIDEKSKIRVQVPVKVLNADKSIGIKRGGALNIVKHELELICSPNSIPEIIEIDIAEVDIGGSVHISSVTLPQGVEPAIKDRDFTIVTVASRAADEEEKPADEAAAAAPAAAAKAAPAAKK